MEFQYKDKVEIKNHPFYGTREGTVINYSEDGEYLVSFNNSNHCTWIKGKYLKKKKSITPP